MARFYSNENIPAQVVTELQRLGHEVVTSLDAGKANSAVPDAEVLAFAAAEGRILLTHNRRHFLRLHQHRTQTTPAWFFALSTRIFAGRRSASIPRSRTKAK
jgi:predicted nuclease of predicted toxin-antitoxin system